MSEDARCLHLPYETEARTFPQYLGSLTVILDIILFILEKEVTGYPKHPDPGCSQTSLCRKVYIPSASVP